MNEYIGDNILIAGNTTSLSFTLSSDIGERVIKAGLYRDNGTPLIELTTKENDRIKKIDERNFNVNLTYEDTIGITGKANLCIGVYTNDKLSVAACKKSIPLIFIQNPVNLNL